MFAKIMDRRRVQIAIGATCSSRRPTPTVLLKFQANCGVCGIVVHGSRAALEPQRGGGGGGNFEHLQRLPLLVLWQERWDRFFAERPLCLPLLSVSPAFHNLFRNRVNVNLPRVYIVERAMIARYLRRRFSTAVVYARETGSRGDSWIIHSICITGVRVFIARYSRIHHF